MLKNKLRLKRNKEFSYIYRKGGKRKADLHFPATPDGVNGNVAAFCLSTLAVNVGKFFVPL